MLKQTKTLLDNIHNCNIKSMSQNDLMSSDINIVRTLEHICTKDAIVPKLTHKLLQKIKDCKIHQLIYLTRFPFILAQLLNKTNVWDTEYITEECENKAILLYVIHIYANYVLFVYIDKEDLNKLNVVRDYNINYYSETSKIIDTFKFNTVNTMFLHTSISYIMSIDKNSVYGLIKDIQDKNKDNKKITDMVEFIMYLC